MIKPELYHKTVGILYDAYFNDTLEHGNCRACAVGNLVTVGCGYSYEPAPPHDLFVRFLWKDESVTKDSWTNVFVTWNNDYQDIRPSQYTGIAKQQIDSTGYAWQELAKIEHAFEKATRGKNREDWMFNGLVAVLELLKEIHQVTDEDLLTANNKRFKDHYNKRVSIG